MNVKIADLEATATKALTRYGYTDQEISVMLPILMYAQLRGNNQGLIKLTDKRIQKDPGVKDVHVIRETKLSAVIDGGMNFAMIPMKRAMELAIAKAKEHGFGIVGTRNTASSTGAIGYYVNEIAKLGLIGFAFAGSPPTVAAHGSSEAIYGTNPLAVGMPANGDPIVLDMATAAIAWFGLIEAKTAGKQIPEGLAYDESGALTTDPMKAMDGAIRAFGGHKGSGLGFMVTALTGPLVGAGFAGIDDGGHWGNLIIAMDPELLIDREQFAKNVSRLAARVKETKKLPGVEEILLPGERGNRLTKSRRSSGEIEIEDNLYRELQKIAE